MPRILIIAWPIFREPAYTVVELADEALRLATQGHGIVIIMVWARR